MKARAAALVLVARLSRPNSGGRWNGPPLVKRPVIIALGVLWLLVGLAGQAMAQDNAAYTVSRIARLDAGETVIIALKVTNIGTVPWNNEGPCAVVLGYHWFKGPTRLASETQAAVLPVPVSPGQTVELAATVNAPTTPGLYTLAWDMRAQCEWFTNLGAAPGRQQVEVVTKP